MFGARNVPAEALGDVAAVVSRIAGRIVLKRSRNKLLQKQMMSDIHHVYFPVLQCP